MLLHLKNGDVFDIAFREEDISYFSGNKEYVDIAFKNDNCASLHLNVSIEDFKEQLKQTKECIFQKDFVETKSDNKVFYIRKSEILYFSVYKRNNKKELFIKLITDKNIISNDDVQQFYLKMNN